MLGVTVQDGSVVGGVTKAGRSRDSDTTKATAIGRALLANLSRERAHNRRVLARSKAKELRRQTLLRTELKKLGEERTKMKKELRSAEAVVVISVMVAAGLGLWSAGVWQGKASVGAGAGAGSRTEQMGQRIADKARRGFGLPPSSASSAATMSSAKDIGSAGVVGLGAVPVSAVVTGEPTVAPAVVVHESQVVNVGKGWSWRGLFWKEG